MHRLHFQRMWGRTGFILACLLLFNSIPQESLAWGRSGQRLIANRAVDTLPVEIRPFFEANRAVLFQHVTDPFDSLAKTPAERRNHFIALDKYGRFPFEALPRQYKAALAKFGKPKLDANGLLPWQIGVYSEKLTEAFRAGKWDEARLDASILAHYVAEAHDPFNTTDNFDGHISGQTGIDGRFGTTLIDRYSSFFPMRPNDAVFPLPVDRFSPSSGTSSASRRLYRARHALCADNASRPRNDRGGDAPALRLPRFCGVHRSLQMGNFVFARTAGLCLRRTRSSRTPARAKCSLCRGDSVRRSHAAQKPATGSKF